MDTKKPKVVGKATAEQIARFQALRAADMAIDATARTMVKSVMATTREQKAEVQKGKEEIWSDLYRENSIDQDGSYHIDDTTGEITVCEHEHAGITSLLRVLNGEDDSLMPGEQPIKH
jgi:hypothetical protein